MSTGFLQPSNAKMFGMDTPGERLRQARKDAKFPSARNAAKRFGWNPSTYASHENGQTPPPKRAAQKYGAAFKVNPAWLLMLSDDKRPDQTDQIVKLVSAIPPEHRPAAIQYLEFLRSRR